MQPGFLKPLIETSRAIPRWKPLAWTVVLTALWSLLWFWPWQAVLQDFIWLRMLIALGIFIVPGVGLYRLMNRAARGWTDQLTFGFALSHLIIALAGLLGRFLQLPFEVIRGVFMALGLILLLPTLVPVLAGKLSLRFSRPSVRRVAVAAALILIGYLVSLIVIQRVLSDDDLTYLAIVTEWQNSPGLDFRDVIFGTGEIIQPRFWLVSTPFAQAFLARASGLPAIFVLGGYYEPFLVFIALLCWYRLARTLNLSSQAAAVSVVLQVVFLLLLSEYLHPGASFFNQLSVDKATATFILAPVFIQSEIRLLREPRRNNVLLFVLTGLSLTLMHPIAVAYAVFIAGVIAILHMKRGRLKTGLIAVCVLVAILIPQVALRIVGADMEGNMLAGIEGIESQIGYEHSVSLWQGSPFYGFNPEILGMEFPYDASIPLARGFLKWGWLVVPLAALIISVRRLTQNHLAQYIFSALLLAVLAGLPLTGWILGYFLSPWMLERAAWFLPFGLSAVFVLLAIRDHTTFGGRLREFLSGLEGRTLFSAWPLAITALFASGLIMLAMRERGLPDPAVFDAKSERYTNLALAGQWLDDHIADQAVVAGSDEINDLIPGLAREASIITFRTSSAAHMPFHSLEEIRERVSDKDVIFARTAPAEERLRLLAKHDVEYLLLRRTEFDFFKNLVAANPSLFERTDIDRYIILRVLQ